MYKPAIHHRRSIRLKGYDYSRAGAYFITICTQYRKSMFGRIINGVMQLNDAGEMIGRWYNELPNKFPDIECDEYQCMPNHIHFIVVNTGHPRSTNHVGADLFVRPTARKININPHNTQNASIQPDCQNNTTVENKTEKFPICTVDGKNESGLEKSAERCACHDDDGRGFGVQQGVGQQTHRSAPTGYTDDIFGEHIGSSLFHVLQWFKTMTTNEYIRGVKQFGWPRFNKRLFQRDYWEHIVRNKSELDRIRHYIANNPTMWEKDKLHGPHGSSKLNDTVHEPMPEYDQEYWMV